MLIKPKVLPADPTKVCRTCSHHEPDLHVCCANDVVVSRSDAEIKSCDLWNPKKICITCGHFDPDTNECWFEEHDMSEEESLTRTCESWEPRKDIRKALSEFMSNDGNIVRARMLESLDVVFGLAIQQAPTLRDRWVRLREQCIGALQMRWKQEDEKKESKP